MEVLGYNKKIVYILINMINTIYFVIMKIFITSNSKIDYI